MKTQEFKLWDTVEKVYFDKSHDTTSKAVQAKYAFFGAGNYPDRPITVVEIHRFNNGKFTGKLE